MPWKTRNTGFGRMKYYKNKSLLKTIALAIYPLPRHGPPDGDTINGHLIHLLEKNFLKFGGKIKPRGFARVHSRSDFIRSGLKLI